MGGSRMELSQQGWELLETDTPRFHAVVAVGRMAMEGFWRRSGFPRFRRVAIRAGLVWAVRSECVVRGAPGRALRLHTAQLNLGHLNLK